MSPLLGAEARSLSPRRGLALALLSLALLGGCGDGGGEDDGRSAATTVADGNEPGTVILKGNEFRPDKISVSVGDTVTWQWNDGKVQHDVNGGDLFKSEIKDSGTFEHTFDKPGVFEYKCTVHPAMTASVEVTE